jgi:hypothetical protein
VRKIAVLALALVISTSLARTPGAQASDPQLEPAQALGVVEAAAEETPVLRVAPEARAQAAAIGAPQELRA